MQQLINDIVAAIADRRDAEALQMSRRLVAAMPDEEGALSLLAVSEQNAGNPDEARRLLERLTREHPGTWQHWNNLGNVLRLLDEMAPAADAYARALTLNDGSARLHANLGLLLLNQGDFAGARERLYRAATMPGAEPGMAIWAAVACYECTDEANAAKLIADWRAWPRQSDEAMLELGWLLVQLGHVEDGETVLRGAFHDETSRIRALARRALALERINRIDAAANLLAQLPDAADIADPKARMETLHAAALVAMRRNDFASARRRYEDALAIDLPARYRQPLYYGLARACDKLDDTRAAMAALAEAHAADLSTAPAHGTPSPAAAPIGLLALADRPIEPEQASGWDNSDSPGAAESPVFVVGFPRSGTTLLEQMLAAHDGFASVDEQPFVQRLIAWLRQRGFAYPDDLGRLGPGERDALRSLYWKHAAQIVTRPPGVRLVDKHPLNFLALPMIRRIFANAPVIFCARHPCDAILSSWMQHFRDPQLAALCASIEQLAHAHRRLTRHWLRLRECFPDNVLVCRYEALVTDSDNQLAALGDFLGVADVSAMRSFAVHALDRGFIGTPSYSQVVQPLNADAIGRWRRYREWFEPVLPVLAPVMEHWGYDA